MFVSFCVSPRIESTCIYSLIFNMLSPVILHLNLVFWVLSIFLFFLSVFKDSRHRHSTPCICVEYTPGVQIMFFYLQTSSKNSFNICRFIYEMESTPSSHPTSFEPCNKEEEKFAETAKQRQHQIPKMETNFYQVQCKSSCGQSPTKMHTRHSD